MRLVILAAIVCLVAPASAQIVEPGPEHYAAAYDSLAVQIAAERLEEADAVSRRLAADIAELRRSIDERRARHNAVIDAWALHVQRLAGERVAYLPGTGWHEVRRP